MNETCFQSRATKEQQLITDGRQPQQNHHMLKTSNIGLELCFKHLQCPSDISDLYQVINSYGNEEEIVLKRLKIVQLYF